MDVCRYTCKSNKRGKIINSKNRKNQLCGTTFLHRPLDKNTCNIVKEAVSYLLDEYVSKNRLIETVIYFMSFRCDYLES